MKFISIDDNIDEKDYEKVEDNSKIAKPSDSTKLKITVKMFLKVIIVILKIYLMKILILIKLLN